jgi:hypothetical protein
MLAGAPGAPAAGYCDGTLCAPECRTDACGTSFWMYPCTGEYICNADCAGCRAIGNCREWRAVCTDARAGRGCTTDGTIERGGC